MEESDVICVKSNLLTTEPSAVLTPYLTAVNYPTERVTGWWDREMTSYANTSQSIGYLIYLKSFYILSTVYWQMSEQTVIISEWEIWCDSDRSSSLICGNKMPTRCNRGFYCRYYFLLNMFRAPLCPSSGAQEYYTVVAACGFSCCNFQVVGLVWSWGHITLSSTPDQQLENHSTKYHRQQPLYNTLELLMMGIMVPETCWGSSKNCTKTSVASIWHFISTY